MSRRTRQPSAERVAIAPTCADCPMLREGKDYCHASFFHVPGKLACEHMAGPLSELAALRLVAASKDADLKAMELCKNDKTMGAANE